MITPVILCGASGTGPWPSARAAYRRQFAELAGSGSLLQDTLRRITGPGFREPLIVTDEQNRYLAGDHAGEIGLHDAGFIIVPEARGTALPVLAAALTLADEPERLLLVTPPDHVVRDAERFRETVEAAAELARAGGIVLLGANPEGREAGGPLLELEGSADGQGARHVAAIHSEPVEERFSDLLKRGAALVNTGMFVARAGDLVAAGEANAPDLVTACREALAVAKRGDAGTNLALSVPERVAPATVEEALLTKAASTVALPLDAGWTDPRSWDRVHDSASADAAGVSLAGPASAFGCENTLLRCEIDGARLVGIGLRNIAAVATPDSLLVVDMDHAEDVEAAVEQLAEQGHPQARDYPRFHRPWGWYETLCLGERFQVKRIMVKPGGILSLQSHVHRSEHWVVVEGTARVTVGRQVKLLSENEYAYIPLGETHRMENPGTVPMYLIEVQTGSYLGEDDIIRYEDIYDRA